MPTPAAPPGPDPAAAPTLPAPWHPAIACLRAVTGGSRRASLARHGLFAPHPRAASVRAAAAARVSAAPRRATTSLAAAACRRLFASHSRAASVRAAAARVSAAPRRATTCLAAAAARRATRPVRAANVVSARGQASVELVVLLPVILVVLAVGYQAVLAGQAIWEVRVAARAAARANSLGADAAGAARAHLPAGLEHGLRVDAREDGDVQVSVRVPTVLPSVRLGRVSATSHFRPQSG